SSPSSITNSGGTLALKGATAPSGTVNANAATTVAGTSGSITETRLLAALNIGGGVAVQITHSQFAFTPTFLKPTTTTYGGGATLDITNNAFITTGTAAGALAQIQSGQILSSEPADSIHSIGYI